MTIEITGELIKADRVSRRGSKQAKMSRQDYGALVGLTPTQIQNLEQGRKLRPEEHTKLEPFIAEYLQKVGSVGGPAANGSDPDAVPRPAGSEPLPIFLFHEELEDDVIPASGEPIVTPGSGLEGAYEWRLDGYHLTNSELSTFRRCLRRWWLGYYRELRFKTQKVTGAAAIGTRFHLCLAAYYSTRRDDPFDVLDATVAHDRALLLSREQVDQEELAQLEKDADLVRAMLEGYLEFVQESGVDAGLTILGDEMVVEAELAEILGTKVILVGKLDVRVRREADGARAFIDHKSVGSLTEPLKTLRINSQMLHYHLLEWLDLIQSGLDETTIEQTRTTGGYYNMARKVKRTGTAKPPFFDRVPVQHNRHELESYRTRVLGEAEDIINLRVLLDQGADPNRVAYPNPTGDCSWDCDYLLVCPMFDDGSRVEDFLATYYEKTDPHERYKPYGDSVWSA